MFLDWKNYISCKIFKSHSRSPKFVNKPRTSKVNFMSYFSNSLAVPQNFQVAT